MKIVLLGRQDPGRELRRHDWLSGWSFRNFPSAIYCAPPCRQEPIGRKAKAVMERGELVPTRLVVAVVAGRIFGLMPGGFISTDFLEPLPKLWRLMI
jgi:hypothetical protein